MSNSEIFALNKLKKDPSLKFLRADKGGKLVIMDRTEYIAKMKGVVEGVDYALLIKDPTDSIDRKLKLIINKAVKSGEIEKDRRFYFYSQALEIPYAYGLIKLHKPNSPLRIIVGSRDSVLYNTAKKLLKVIDPLAGDTEFGVKNSYTLMEDLRNVRLTENLELGSLDIVNLYTRIPVDKSLSILKNKLENDVTFRARTNLSVETVLELAKLCLENSYFSFDNSFYKQVNGLAMGSPLSPIIANLYLEHFESQIFNNPSFASPSNFKLWRRYMDDILILKPNSWKNNDVLTLMNTLDDDIKFTYEAEVNNSITFLDLLLIRDGDRLKSKIYQKPTHAKSYIDFYSAHPKNIKIGVIKMIKHKIESLSDYPDEDKEIFTQQLVCCNYPRNLVKSLFDNKNVKLPNLLKDKNDKNILVLPYVKSVSEKTTRQLKLLGVDVVSSGAPSLGSVLIKNKPKRDPMATTGVVYEIGCQCGKKYIGETKRTLATRINEHKKCLTTANMSNGIAKHMWNSQTGHAIEWDKARILKREKNWFRRTFKEGVYIAERGKLNLDRGRVDVQSWGDLKCSPSVRKKTRGKQRVTAVASVT